MINGDQLAELITYLQCLLLSVYETLVDGFDSDGKIVILHVTWIKKQKN